jgi:predicted dehydrogenase
MTGFNRRFSPYARRIRELVQERRNPMILNYRMNAGYIPPDHWVHGEEGGGRNLGEACHVYDLFTFLTGSHIRAVEAMSLRPSTGNYRSSDNFVVTVRFDDGSVASLTYTALGSKEFPKESLEIYMAGKVIEMKDYRRLTIHGAKIRGLETKNQEKGHPEELDAFARAVREGGEWPIPLWQQLQAMEIALLVEEQYNN